ncbi:MAG: SIMPL domain-containing protein [Nevskia sp.]|nr:SIMPL domain-containing protein [Nevskia sp.]
MNAPLRSAAALFLLCAASAQARETAVPPGPMPFPHPPERRTVTVGGQGEVSAAPDRARLSMAVEETRPELKTAQADVNRVVREYLAQARALGAKDEDISTAGLNIRAEYDYSGKEGRKFLGYHVTRSIEIVVRDLDRIGDFLQRATGAGINNVSDPQLESSKADELRRQALAKAAQDAQAKARILAETLDVKLGAVHTINANAEALPPPGPRPRVLMAAAAPEPSGNEEMGFSAGQIRYTATLTAEFDLVPP